jgi:predicted NBD/HSP70 family sugar kinase
VTAGLRKAAAHLPRVEAIGGSAAGIWVDNRVKAASLFRAVPADVFKREVTPMFSRIQREWDVPLVVVNDGDVSALAGGMTLKSNAILGIAMGSSEAAGYLNRKGCLTGQLNELAFTPVDFNPGAVVDPWSGDRGTGALYFSQQAVNKLAPAAGVRFPEDLPLPERLKVVQGLANAGDRQALAIFETIGVYFGYEAAHYAEYYDVEHVLLLGRVMSGRGGEVILEKARDALRREFPELAERLTLHIPDERSRRVGQAVAAASLPELPRGNTRLKADGARRAQSEARGRERRRF